MKQPPLIRMDLPTYVHQLAAFSLAAAPLLSNTIQASAEGYSSEKYWNDFADAGYVSS